MLASVRSATVLGVRGSAVTVEVHVSQGLPGFSIVGLPDEACREARDRVRAAVLSCGLTWPLQRVTVNLAPSNVRKIGAGLDLPIAVALLASTVQIPSDHLEDLAFIGELGLDGSLRPVPGMVPMVATVGERTVVVPEASLDDALVVTPSVRCGASLVEVVAALRGDAPWPTGVSGRSMSPVDRPDHGDLADVRGHPMARLALEIAAAGHHHLLMVGPPGSGKTMLATRLAGLLPELDRDIALEATMAHSAAGLSNGLVTWPPVRSPHHTASLVSLIGGGTGAMRPGEVALAHGGVLFLDELAEFPPSVLNGLRQPLEDKVVRVDRARGSVVFPADFLLVAAMNPCPCGDGDRPGSCRCPEAVRERYRRRVSGPLLDRFDLRLIVRRAPVDDLLASPPGENTTSVACRVRAAVRVARQRGVRANGLIPAGRLDRLAPLSPAAVRLVRDELSAGRLSARGLHRVRRVARTIADLWGHDDPISADAVALALQLRIDVAAADRGAP